MIAVFSRFRFCTHVFGKGGGPVDQAKRTHHNGTFQPKPDFGGFRVKYGP